jgi:transcriptional regulator with XRE-family HTH domain
MAPIHDSLARRALLRVLQRTTAAAMSKRLRVHHSTITRYANGEIQPAEDVQVRLEREYGIGRPGWSQPPPRLST